MIYLSEISLVVQDSVGTGRDDPRSSSKLQVGLGVCSANDSLQYIVYPVLVSITDYSHSPEVLVFFV